MTGYTMDRDEFLRRFKTRLRDILGENYDAKYIDEIAPSYWNDPDQRAEGPEQCAEYEASEWGDE